MAALRKKTAIKKAKEAVEKKELPTDSFTIEQFNKVWKEYTDKLIIENKHIVQSILSENTPQLKGTEIHLTFYNQTMKQDLLHEKLELMNFIRTKLNNHDIDLVVHVDEQSTQKFIYTTVEKLQFLVDKNPLLLDLKKEFKLDF